MTSSPASDLSPLSTPVLHILLALGRDRLHGYGIMQAIEEKTAGVARILPGTLYTTLNRMLADGLVEEAAPPNDAPDDDRRRRYYRITPAGRKAVAAEAERMSMLLELARRDLRIS
ncbi:MAG TPA: helix-turn-helix transcriptional regulator [Longimicrobiales bacterium]|nr:helix-turn-helix transcriptional regulator [Longimicrobiales bacterium]